MEGIDIALSVCGVSICGAVAVMVWRLAKAGGKVGFHWGLDVSWGNGEMNKNKEVDDGKHKTDRPPLVD